jgi:heme/copper-type cytochrome/quinol oxidase subunit 2
MLLENRVRVFLFRKSGLYIFALVLLMCGALLFVSPRIPMGRAEITGAAINFFLVVEPDIGGQGYFAFSPQALIAQQGDQINITVRNLANQSFQLEIQNEPRVTVQAGVDNGSGVTPTDTSVPVFTVSTPGIFSFSTVEHPEMNGQLVVLPTDWISYNPQPETRSLTQLVLPDFAGTGYDKFFPGVMVVNQGDSVSISIRNTDDMAHGFTIAAYGIDAAVNPGSALSNGTIPSLTTAIPTFTATNAGVFTFLCTVYCGPGHLDMTGSLVVLPKGNSGYNPEASARYSYLTVKPDFAGEGYDKYLPDTIIVNQNDLVYVKVSNTDQNTHGFTLPDFGITNETIAGGQNTTQGLIPNDTYITPFYANQPGVHEFFCGNYCGQGHDQMIGYLVVLPTINATSTNSGQPLSGTLPSVVLLLLSVALLIVGFMAGIIIGAMIGRTGPEKKN